MDEEAKAAWTARKRLQLPISTPRQQVAAVVATRDFLLRLTNPGAGRKWGEVRQEARALLRHYPTGERLRPVLEAGLGGVGDSGDDGSSASGN